MVLEGVIIYTSISSFAASMLAFYAAGIAMYTGKAILLSILFSGIMSGLFYLFTLWAGKQIRETKVVSFPFIVSAIPELEESPDKEIELDINDIEIIDD